MICEYKQRTCMTNDTAVGLEGPTVFLLVDVIVVHLSSSAGHVVFSLLGKILQ